MDLRAGVDAVANNKTLPLPVTKLSIAILTESSRLGRTVEHKRYNALQQEKQKVLFTPIKSHLEFKKEKKRWTMRGSFKGGNTSMYLII
jgi:hypothetical protein